MIPDGIYLAPVGGSIEVLQLLGGRTALNPRVYLTPTTFTTANAALVGPMQVEGSTLSMETGRYELDGWTLRLRPSTGPARALLIFPYDLYGRFDPIYLDGGMMRKRR